MDKITDEDLKELQILYGFATTEIESHKSRGHLIKTIFALKIVEDENLQPFTGLFKCLICGGKLTLFIVFNIPSATGGGIIYSFFKDLTTGELRQDYLSWGFFYVNNNTVYLNLDVEKLKGQYSNLMLKSFSSVPAG